MDGSKTVLIVTGMKPNKYGSMERYFVEVAKECRGRGYQSIFQFESIPASPVYIQDLENAGATIVVQPLNVSVATAIRSAFQLLFRFKPKVVHTHFVQTVALIPFGLYGRLIARKRTIATIHNKAAHSKKSPVRFVLNLFHWVLPVSDGVLQGLRVAGVNELSMKVHYLGLFDTPQAGEMDREKIRELFSVPGGALILGCIAFDAPFKGVDVLLNALAQVLEKQRDVFLLSIGIDKKKSSKVQLAQELAISDRVIWAGIIDNGSELLKAVDIYVQPSRSSEGLPLAIMEAMSQSLPVVATKVSGNLEAVIDGQTGFLAEPNDPHDLADRILEMISLREEWCRFGRNGLEHFRQNFLGDASIKKLMSFYFEDMH
jgi:glycosyltransferase involved in cell wall biosynthesis